MRIHKRRVEISKTQTGRSKHPITLAREDRAQDWFFASTTLAVILRISKHEILGFYKFAKFLFAFIEAKSIFSRLNYSPRSKSLISLAAWRPSSFKFFSICRLLAKAALSSADIAQPMMANLIFFFSEMVIQ